MDSSSPDDFRCPISLEIMTDPYPSDSVALSSLLRSVQKSAEFRQKVADSSIPKALIRHVADPQLPELQKLAIYSLLYLSLDGDDVKVGLVAEGAVLEGSGKREKKEAATALYELCKFPENRRRLIRVAGSVRSLVELAGSGLDRAVEVLAQLGKIKEGRADMGRIQGFVRVLVGVLERGSARGVESAISVLNLVCSEDERLGLEAMNEGLLGVLERLSNEEGGKIGKNSAALLEKLKRGIVKWV
ncbi:U-box domain-containing protein 8 [Asparagus officinalis]|uniref:U-box domain-containing protein 8 n=1 Tax=Asparagus officinalis TaxID=4686 RepID=UPI00098E0973|nr:U-box domain-containing protein 8 [Asparagus officinalis]